MSGRLLFVDDEEDLLTFFRNVFEKEHEVVGAASAEAALEILRVDNSFSVISADLNMPGLDGIDFLQEVKNLAPHAVRMMLTGYATKDAAISAVNEADIFRFLTKPIVVADLKKAVQDANRTYEIGVAERVLLEQTVKGSVSMLVEVLSMAHPIIFGRATARLQLVNRLCEALEIDDQWVVETAALLCNIGMLALPQNVLQKVVDALPMEAKDIDHLHAQAAVGAEIVRRVPRLESVADAILLQYKNFDGSGYPEENPLKGQAIPVGARLLRLVNEYQTLLAQGYGGLQALEMLRSDAHCFDHRLLRALTEIHNGAENEQTLVSVSVHSLREGAVLAHDILNTDNVLIVRAGQEVSDYLAQRLRNFANAGLIPDKIAIRV